MRIRTLHTVVAAIALTAAQPIAAECPFQPRFYRTAPGFTGETPAMTAVADVDGADGPDVIAVNRGSVPLARVAVLLGRGDGTLADPVFYDVGASPTALVVAELDGVDGPDLAVSNEMSGDVSVLLNQGDGTFAAQVRYAVGGSPSFLAAVDLDAGARPDLVVSNETTNDLSVLYNNGDGTFLPEVRRPAGMAPSAVVAADFDRGNGPDVAVANRLSGDVSVLLNRGDGTLADPVQHPTAATAARLVALDLDGADGPDLVVLHATPTNQLVQLINDGAAGFSSVPLPLAATGLEWLAAADFDGVNGPDLAVQTDPTSFMGRVYVFLNQGTGSLAPPVSYPGGWQLQGAGPTVIAAEIDGNAGIDLVATGSGITNGGLFVLPGRGDGTFTSYQHYDALDIPAGLHAADIDGVDGADLVWVNLFDDRLTTFLSDGGQARPGRVRHDGGAGAVTVRSATRRALVPSGRRSEPSASPKSTSAPARTASRAIFDAVHAVPEV